MALNRPEGTSFLDFGASRRNMSSAGYLYVSPVAVVGPTDTVENTLFTYTLPKKSLNTDKKGIRIRVTVRTAATAGTKRIRVYFGSTVIFDTTATAFSSAATMITLIAEVLRVSKSVQVATALAICGTVPTIGTTAPTTITGLVSPSAPAENTSSDIIIKTTSTNGSAVAAEATGVSMIVEAVTDGQMA